jgi:hypothetical protein
MNEPAPVFATLVNLHGPPLRESPIGAWATRIACETEEKAIAPNRDRTVAGRKRLAQLGRCVFQGMTPVSEGEKNDPWRFDAPGVMHLRRTVGLDIPCQVARLQSLTPLLQARGVYRAPGEGTRLAEAREFARRIARSETQHGSPRKDASVQVGKDTPEEIKKDFGRPRRKCVDFLLLIGAIYAVSDPEVGQVGITYEGITYEGTS